MYQPTANTQRAIDMTNREMTKMNGNVPANKCVYSSRSPETLEIGSKIMINIL